MGERRGTKALELWCRRITDGYPGVNVQNMTTSWRDGLAFCAMIHHFRPDLVDFNALNKDDVYGNNELAFRTAEQHLGIPALLDAEDMASCAVPDRLSILTYLSQFYQTFGGLSPSRPAMKRAKEETDGRLASVSGSPQPKVGVRLGVRKEPCVVCGLPVFLAEKLVISRSLYHRTCFRCARCNNQLTIGNYYETEEGQYCCETCPDEEVKPAPIMHQDYNKTALLGGRDNYEEYQNSGTNYKRALSDEEKENTSKRNNDTISLTPDDTKASVTTPSSSEEAKSRINFMTNHLLTGYQDERFPSTDYDESPHPADNESETPDPETFSVSSVSPFVKQTETSVESERFEDSRDIDTVAIADPKTIHETDERSVNKDYSDVNIGSNSSFSSSSRINQHTTAIATHDVDYKSIVKFNEDTKDTLLLHEGREKTRNYSGERLSLVQQRMKIFENSINPEKGGAGNNEPNSLVNIPSKIERNKDKAEVNSAKTYPEETCESSPVLKGDHDSLNTVEDAAEDSSGNIEPSEEPSQLPESKPLAANTVLKKMMDAREPRKDASSVDTSLSNVSGIDLSVSGEYPEDLNPFQSDDSDHNEEEQLRRSSVNDKTEKYASTNPFGSSDDDEDQKEATPPRPAARKHSSIAKKNKDNGDVQPPARRRLEAPQISLNPFWSDEEDQESDDDKTANTETKSTPVPKPRKMKPTPEPSPVPRKTSFNREGLYASNSSIASTGSLITPGGTYRKKKPAPPPPPAEEMFSHTSTFDTLISKLPEDMESVKVVSERTPRTRKMKPAPPPPISTSTPQSLIDSFSAKVNETEDSHSGIWDDQKNSKDETNRNRQSLSTLSSTDESGQQYSVPFVDKSAQGKWKRKKGPAPPRPIPHKRKIKVMSVKDVKLELDEIELQQQGLEKQGVRLEQLIRDKCETGQENEEFTSLRVDVEELVLELFALVNEKNELFRRQAELMLLRRQQRLEEEHADVEYQIRCLMSQPEATKTDSDKQREEVLIQRLVEIVERRNEIVECLEMDRRREVEEDRSINEQMGLFAAKNKGEPIVASDGVHNSSSPKKEKTKEKVKDKKVKKSHKKDADKDVDETEMKLKRHKKKWF